MCKMTQFVLTNKNGLVADSEEKGKNVMPEFREGAGVYEEEDNGSFKI